MNEKKTDGQSHHRHDPKFSQWLVGRRWCQTYPRIVDDNTVSLFWPYCSNHRKTEEIQWRRLSVWVFRLYPDWYVHIGHESIWRPSSVWEEGSYCLLLETRSHYFFSMFCDYYEVIKRELNRRLIYECRCDERLRKLKFWDLHVSYTLSTSLFIIKLSDTSRVK